MNNWISRVVVALLLLSSPLTAQTVTGRVTAVASGLPLGGADVKMGDRWVGTDTGGVFVMRGAPEGTHTLTVQYPDYHSLDTTINVGDAASKVFLDLKLASMYVTIPLTCGGDSSAAQRDSLLPSILCSHYFLHDDRFFADLTIINSGPVSIFVPERTIWDAGTVRGYVVSLYDSAKNGISWGGEAFVSTRGLPVLFRSNDIVEVLPRKSVRLDSVDLGIPWQHLWQNNPVYFSIEYWQESFPQGVPVPEDSVDAFRAILNDVQSAYCKLYMASFHTGLIHLEKMP